MAMSRARKEYRLDLTICAGQSLFSGGDLEVFERILLEQARPWSSRLHVWQGGRGKRELVGGGLVDTIREVAAERGELYRQLTETYGPGPYERRSGSVELRGSDGALIVVVALDEYIFAPSAGFYRWGNTITVQFCRRHCCGRSAAELCRAIAEDACSAMNVLYAHGHMIEEYDAKNMSRERGVMAIGVDVSRYLPGLYWLNYFGEPYCKLMGRERLLRAPAFESRLLSSGGVLMLVDEDPESWKSETTRYPDVLQHIGDRYFFLRDKPDRETEAPPYGLKKLPRVARFT